jgi:hypothetical protein
MALGQVYMVVKFLDGGFRDGRGCVGSHQAASGNKANGCLHATARCLEVTAHHILVVLSRVFFVSKADFGYH